MGGKFDPNDHLSKVSGAQYLEVKWRLVWFRDQYPEGQIDTDVVDISDDRAVFHATVTAIKDGSVVGRASGTGSEAPRDFRDYIEKAETKAVGRALAMLGFGTQFAPEFDEGDRIVDSPVRATVAPQRTKPSPEGSNRVATPHAQKPITTPQMNQLFALATEIAEKRDWPKDWVKEDLYQFFTVTSTKELTTAQGAHAIRALYGVKDRGLVFADALAQMKGQ